MKTILACVAALALASAFPIALPGIIVALVVFAVLDITGMV